MDIGDPSEIPATRRRLPSMQELGAFDIAATADAGAAVESRPVPLTPAAPPPSAPAADAAPAPRPKPGSPRATEPMPAAPPTRPAELDADAAPASPAPAARPSLTPDQLRQALAKADPHTRQKLLRLIAGGRTVQQVGSAGTADGSKRRSLVMQLDGATDRAATPPRPAAATAAPSPQAAWSSGGTAASGFGAFTAGRAGVMPPAGPAARAPTAAPRPQARPGRGTDQPLMQIDEHTELLDAAPVAPTPAARKAELQAQLELAQAQAQAEARQQAQAGTPGPVTASDPSRGEPSAHKVLFPAYDPSRHGEDVHGVARRRRDGPIEGHYPAPRQPFKPTYRHADGRPMDAEESKVEEVLQTQRCEETLGVLARDGVNGLLLSPRDLDAAVANGVISADAAATLWKTWAALRPVIHVIEDDPPASVDGDASADAAEAADAADAAVDANDTREAPVGTTGLDGASASPVAVAAAPVPLPEPAPIAVEPGVPAPSAPVHVDPADSAKLAMELPKAATPAHTEPAAPADAPTLPLPDRRSRPSLPPEFGQDTAETAPPLATPGRRIKALVRLLFWAFVGYCVLATSGRLAMLGWLRWGHWLGG